MPRNTSEPASSSGTTWYKYFEAEKYISQIRSIHQISENLMACGLSLNTITCRAPTEKEHNCWAPPRNEKLCYKAWSQKHMRVGALLPVQPFFTTILSCVGLAPFQLSPNSHRFLVAIKSLYRFMGWKAPFVQKILYLFNLKSNPDRVFRGEEFFYLALYPERGIFLKTF